MSIFVVWPKLFDALEANGVIADAKRTRKLVLTAEVGKPCTIDLEMYADNEYFDEILHTIVRTDNPDDAIVR